MYQQWPGVGNALPFLAADATCCRRLALSGAVEQVDACSVWLRLRPGVALSHIQPDYQNNTLPYVYTTPSGIDAPRCSLFTLSGDMRGRRYMVCLAPGHMTPRHRRLGALGESEPFNVTCSCDVMHSQLLGSDALWSLTCSASQEVRGDVDAWPDWHHTPYLCTISRH